MSGDPTSAGGQDGPDPGSPVAGASLSPDLPGPFPVGRYAHRLQQELRKRARVLLIGEVAGVGRSKVQAYFEIRDADGAVPCAIWIDALERLGLSMETLRDGAQVVVAGGPDYYPGGAHSSPNFSFRVTHVRLAGEGDLLARLAELRRRLEADGLFEPQKKLPRPLLPKTIGVVTAERGAARADVLAGLIRRGWQGTVIWAFAAVQDRHAAPSITAAVQELAARPEVEAIIVCRGGGSLADLWAFCDETLCRTVALLRVPVISAVGHDRDTTLIDDVAAVACSTPTHAAEAAVPLDCLSARSVLVGTSATLRKAAHDAIAERSRNLGALARGPARALQRERGSLSQLIREIRAAAERGLVDRRLYQSRIGTTVLVRVGRRTDEALTAAVGENRRRAIGMERSGVGALALRKTSLEQFAVALRAHDPERTLERGYALAEAPGGEPITGAAGAVEAGRLRLRFSDGSVGVIVEDGLVTPIGEDEADA